MSTSAAGDLPLRTSAHPSDPAPELQVARDMARRGLPLATAVVLIAGAAGGAAGAASAGFGVVLVLINFLVSAWLLATTARISYALLMATALFGYLLRLALIGAVVFAVKDASWVEPVALGLTLVVTHLGLLVWELRYVSASLAYPGLKPATKEIASR
jgi:hypothetical protein